MAAAPHACHNTTENVSLVTIITSVCCGRVPHKSYVLGEYLTDLGEVVHNLLAEEQRRLDLRIIGLRRVHRVPQVHF